MALVAYDYDSTSENEEEEEDGPSSAIILDKNTNFKINSEESSISDQPKVTNSQVNNIYGEELDTVTGHFEPFSKNEATSSKGLFSALPETKTVYKGIVEDTIEDFIPKPISIPVKKERKKVKITIPSLSQFQDDDDDGPEVKKVKHSSKGSGLISLLPPVKGAVNSNTTFVPNVVSKINKPASSTTSTNSLVPDTVRNNSQAKKAAALKKFKEKAKIVLSDAESDDDLDVPETYDDEIWEKICGRPKNKPVIQEPYETLPQETINIAPEPEQPYEGLDNKAFKELVGKSRRPMGNIKLIDIHEEEILADKDLWMAKSLTDPEMAPKVAIEDPVDPTRRKKHHITYLAQQAKANEQDLKNQWATNKTNKFASRAKYGF